MVLVDTTVWVDYFRGARNPHTEWLDVHVSEQRIGLTDLILCEVLQGIRDNAEFRDVREQLLNYELFQTGGIELAVASANNFRHLRASGYTVRKTIDCIIATFCLLNGHSLLHRDRDYDVFERVLKLPVVYP